MRDAERVESAHSRIKPSRDTCKPGSSAVRQGPVPMDIGNVQIHTVKRNKQTPAEREKCMKEGLCLRCREKGHMAKNCPKRPEELSTSHTIQPSLSLPRQSTAVPINPSRIHRSFPSNYHRIHHRKRRRSRTPRRYRRSLCAIRTKSPNRSSLDCWSAGTSLDRRRSPTQSHFGRIL